MTKKSVKILFALQVLGQPRNSKRIAMLQEAGFTVEAVAFERKYHQGRVPDCPVRIIGRIEQGRYLKRLIKMVAAMPALRRAIKLNDIVYAFGPDMALLCRLSGLGLGKPIALEIGDIRDLQTATGLKGKVIRLADRMLTNSCQLLIVTAQGYIDEYYRKWVGTKIPAIVIENKLEALTASSNNLSQKQTVDDDKPLADRPLKIGYFGLLRCDRSWRALLQLALNKPKEIEIIVAGMALNPEDLPEQAQKIANISYKGQYRSPQDLPGLYGDVDIVWACYPFPESDRNHNWRWARTNRFYESCFYQKPMISLEGSGDAVEIRRHDIGITVPNADIDQIVQSLEGINAKQLASWQRNMTELPKTVYIYRDEITLLPQALANIEANYKK